jgi:hypothetical protein
MTNGSCHLIFKMPLQSLKNLWIEFWLTLPLPSATSMLLLFFV